MEGRKRRVSECERVRLRRAECVADGWKRGRRRWLYSVWVCQWEGGAVVAYPGNVYGCPFPGCVCGRGGCYWRGGCAELLGAKL